MSTPDSFGSELAQNDRMDLNPSVLDAPGHFLQESFGFETFYKKAKKLCPLNYFLSSTIEQLSEIYENGKMWDRKISIFLPHFFHFHTIFNENSWNFLDRKISNKNISKISNFKIFRKLLYARDQKIVKWTQLFCFFIKSCKSKCILQEMSRRVLPDSI